MPIRVRLMHRTNRRFIEARWNDPVTGKLQTRSTGTAARRAAERFAARLEDQLNSGGLQEPTRTTWEDLWKRYQAEVLAGQAVKTRDKTKTAIKSLETMIAPKLASSLTTEVLMTFSAQMREKGLSPYTIKGYLGEVRKILRWGERLGLVAAAPRVEMPKRLSGMKGRAITGEEFDRLLKAVRKVCPREGVKSWVRLLRGLWLSGLRLREAMQLHWTDERNLCVDLTGKYPMLRIQAHAQKSRQFELLPITADFAAFLQETPKEERRGFVFDPCPLKKPYDERLLPEWVGKIISRIGAKAGIKVNDGKFASAHDLRRAFGTRWAVHVMPAVLQALMRHKSISTTMQFYVGKNAEAMAEAAWSAAAGNTFGNTSPKRPAEPTSR